MNHALQCRCGTLKGEVAHTEVANRGVCYCKDCQAFARFLGHADEILDESGGTDVVATLASNVTITEGASALACMSLSENGLLRWYARCCNTPIGNTTRNFKLPYVGLVHSCLEKSGTSLDAAFGPVRMRVNTQSATRGRPNATPLATVAAVWAVHDLGAENLKLLQAAPDRVPYLYEELPGQRVLRPFPVPDEWKTALTGKKLGALPASRFPLP